jgi:hypothetical protein
MRGEQFADFFFQKNLANVFSLQDYGVTVVVDYGISVIVGGIARRNDSSGGGIRRSFRRNLRKKSRRTFRTNEEEFGWIVQDQRARMCLPDFT